MITTKEAKVLADDITEAALLLSGMSKKAAELGLLVSFKTITDVSVDYPFSHVWVEQVVVDLNWISPEKLAALAAEEEEDGRN